MDKIVRINRTLRNNWKKTIFGAVVLCYCGSKAREKYQINLLMRAACKEAASFGYTLIPMDRHPTMVTVILNPVANKRKAKQEFEKYCEPLFHLAGLQIDIKQTTSEGNAKEIVESLRGTEAIIIAGGDGTLSESVTGLLRRNDNANQFPLGILPLGRSNTLGNILFPGGKGVDKVKQLIEACMAIIEGHTEWKDAMKIEPILSEDETPSRPIYAMSSLEWGVFRDTLAKKDKYWLFGSLRDFVAFIFNGYKSSLTWNCTGQITYTPPCAGCINCMEKKPEIKRKWAFLLPTTTASHMNDIKTLNPECDTKHELCFKTCDFHINTSNIEKTSELPAITIKLGENSYTYTEYISEGWNRLKGKTGNCKNIPVRTVELIPKDADNVMIEIDKEEFEVKPVKITLLPKVVKLFCKLNHQ